MQIFQNFGVSRVSLRISDRETGVTHGFARQLEGLRADRFGAAHMLKPVLDGDESAFFTCGDDPVLQRMWALEHGMGQKSKLDEILLAQIEEHRTEVFYNLDPMRYGGDFVRRLPSCVKSKICWRAAPSPGANLADYDFVLCNFPSILKSWREAGCRAEYFTPAHDPVLDGMSSNREREVDIIFVGTFSRHHLNRAGILEAVAAMANRYSIRFFIQESRFTHLAETPLGIIPPLRKYRMPRLIRDVSAKPVFGMDLYQSLSQSKIVLNGAIDMAGPDRGNMRCFEAMGAGALLLSDAGIYPEGMQDGSNMLCYESLPHLLQMIPRVLGDWEAHQAMARLGNEMIRSKYSKQAQWARFIKLVG